MAGSCLCSMYKELDKVNGQNINLIVCVLKCNEKDDRFKDTKLIVDWAKR